MPLATELIAKLFDAYNHLFEPGGVPGSSSTHSGRPPLPGTEKLRFSSSTWLKIIDCPLSWSFATTSPLKILVNAVGNPACDLLLILSVF